MILVTRKNVSLFSVFVFSGVYFYVNWNGLKLTPDSYRYIDAANNFNLEFLLNEFVHWPPLYSFVLSLFIDHVFVWAFFINYVSIALSIVIWIYIGHKNIENDRVFGLFIFCLVISTPVFAVTHFVWSESLFLLLFALLLFSFYKIINEADNSWSNLFVLVGILLCYQRHTGIIILIGLILGLLVCQPKKKRLLIVLLISLLLGSSWLIIQSFYGESYHFSELIPHFNFGRNGVLVINEIIKWFLPTLGISMGSLIIFGLGLFLILYFRKIQKQVTIFYSILLVVVLVYFTFFIVIPANSDDISRFMVVAYYPFIFILFSKMENLLLILSRFKYFGYLVLALFISYKLARLTKNAMMWH